jgi:hypothetical protein
MVSIFTFVSILILLCVSSSFVVRPAALNTGLTDFEEVDAYISAKMKELGIPGADLVIVQGDQIVHLKGLSVASSHPPARIARPLSVSGGHII